jgi:hypothetical protein
LSTWCSNIFCNILFRWFFRSYSMHFGGRVILFLESFCPGNEQGFLVSCADLITWKLFIPSAHHFWHANSWSALDFVSLGWNIFLWHAQMLNHPVGHLRITFLDWQACYTWRLFWGVHI